MTAADEKIHPFLTSSLANRRADLIAEHVRAALHFEVASEHIEEREYDEQEHLRIHRIIDRRVFRGEVYLDYSRMVSGLRERGVKGEDLEAKVRNRLDADLGSAASTHLVTQDLRASLGRYGDLLPEHKWPVFLCMAGSGDEAGRLREHLKSLGFPVPDSGMLERYGIIRFGCPPELSFMNRVAGLPHAVAIADPLTPVAAPQPMSVSATAAENRQVLGVTEEMAANYGHGITIAVLDTGVDRSHPAFTRMQREDYSNFTVEDEADVQGHGTHVAAIAAGADPTRGGRYSGIAPRTHLVVGKVMSSRQSGTLDSVLRGMAWAVFEKRADIISLSLGDSGTPPNGKSLWTRACEESFRQGCVVCVAAGNPYPPYPGSVTVPGDAVHAVTVGAIDRNRRLAGFSAWGSTDRNSPLFGKPNCVGPGVDIVAARSSTAAYDAQEIADDLHVRLSGTSMAAPAVAGCLALLKSKARSHGWAISPEELTEVFYAACLPLTDADGRQCRGDFEIGHGLADMRAAFREVERSAPSRAPQEATEPLRAKQAGRLEAGSPSVAGTSSESGAFETGLCYSCGRRYASRVGTFSPVWGCARCAAPLCVVCWQLGVRECGKHRTADEPGRSGQGSAGFAG
jgi:subtilisin family serine protease